MKSISVFALGFGLCAAAAACGGSSNNLPLTEVGITPNGLTSTNIQIAKGGQVRFTNGDIGPHQIASNPDQTHSDCTELNGPVLLQGRSFTATMRNADITCGINDHLNPSDTRYQTTITVGAGGLPSTTQNPSM